MFVLLVPAPAPHNSGHPGSERIHFEEVTMKTAGCTNCTPEVLYVPSDAEGPLVMRAVKEDGGYDMYVQLRNKTVMFLPMPDRPLSCDPPCGGVWTSCEDIACPERNHGQA